MKEKDTKEDKINRILTALSIMKIGDSITPTNLAKTLAMHKDTLTEKLEEYEPVKNINWRLSRDSKQKIRMITKTDEDIDLRKSLRNIEKDLILIKNKLEI